METSYAQLSSRDVCCGDVDRPLVDTGVDVFGDNDSPGQQPRTPGALSLLASKWLAEADASVQYHMMPLGGIVQPQHGTVLHGNLAQNLSDVAHVGWWDAEGCRRMPRRRPRSAECLDEMLIRQWGGSVVPIPCLGKLTRNLDTGCLQGVTGH